MYDVGAAEQVWRRHGGQTVTSGAGTWTYDQESVTVVDSGVDQSLNQRVCSICRQIPWDDT